MNLTYFLPIGVIAFFIVGSWAIMNIPIFLVLAPCCCFCIFMMLWVGFILFQWSRRQRLEDRQRLREANWRAGDRRR
jgi:hypothetical protein